MTQDQNGFENLMGDVLRMLPQLEGWCTPAKANALVRYILQEKPALVVELGVFGGSSFVPQLMALRYNQVGRGVGIDPWSKDASLENMKDEVNREWWGKLNYQAVYNRLVQFLAVHGLDSLATLVTSKSEDYADQFEDESIGLLHIDGNHSRTQSLADAEKYLPKVKTGGIIVFDDIWWSDGHDDPTTGDAVRFLTEHCTRLEVVGTDCMVLRKCSPKK